MDIYSVYLTPFPIYVLILEHIWWIIIVSMFHDNELQAKSFIFIYAWLWLKKMNTIKKSNDNVRQYTFK